MRVTIIHKQDCDKCDKCPAVMQTEAGDFIVQGKRLGATEREALSVPADEDIVLFPEEELLKAAAKLLGRR